MKRNKLLTLFATALLWLGGQNANAITLTAVTGDHWGSSESPVQLVDGKTGTKWGNGGDGPHYAIIKSDLPLTPASYVLRIANDTNSNPGRNWKTWKIYGGNFATDDAATKDAEGWMLIDAQTDVELPTDQYKECPITVSGDDKNFYTYFMIVVEHLVQDGQYMQMDEFWFDNYTVDISKFDEQIQKCKDFDLTGVDEPLTAEYNAKLNELTNSEDPAAIEKLIGELNTLQGFITEYKDKAFAPLSAIGEGVWGDGSWTNLIDGNMDTKCGGGLPAGGAWLVFRANGGAQPFVYSLVTGKDTKSYPGRNWKTWKIYGANYDKVSDATRDAEGWVLLDSRENVGQDLFPAENLSPAAFSFSEFPDGLDKTYYYFKVELTAAYDGTAYQMTEIEFLSKQQVEDTRSSFLAEFDGFDVEALVVEPSMADVKAEYVAKMEELKTTNDVVAMSKAYNALKELRKKLQASANYVAGNCYRPLDGNTAWGDGENWTKLVDGDIETKWGGGMPEGGSYVVFRAYEANKFNQYMLVTGNDTKNSPDRNWKTWKIYGANVKGDMDDMATRDFTGWKLIDQKSDIGQDLLPGDNFTPAFFSLSEDVTTKYKYFKIEVEAAYNGGGSIQMSEFKFLSDEDYAAIRQELVDSLTKVGMALAEIGEQIDLPAAVKEQIVSQLTVTVGGMVAEVAEAPASELLPKFNTVLKFINEGVMAMVADYNLEEVDGVYQISKPQQMVTFAAIVNSGNPNVDAVLTSDIDMTAVMGGWTPIGDWSSGNVSTAYSGHFDGQGYTITSFDGTSSQNYYGIFGVISTGALIENFSVYGTITGSHKTMGVVGYARDATPTIRNIHSYLNINNTVAGNRYGGILGSSVNGTIEVQNCTYSGKMDCNDAGGSGNYGGIVGYVNNNAAAILNITNCLFDGEMINSAETPGGCTVGGFVGYSNGGIVTIKNSLSIGTVQSKIAAQFFGAVKNAKSALVNCYYVGENVNGSASTVEIPSTLTNDDQLASGEIACKLGGGWGQTLGENADPYPVPGKFYVIESDGKYVNPSVEEAKGDAACILPSMKYDGAYDAYTFVAQADYEYGDWSENNPNYNVIVGAPAEQDGIAWYAPGFSVNGWNYGKDLPQFGDGRPADVYAVRYFTVEGEIPSTLYMPAPHDDAPCEYYINGELIWAETDGWNEDEVIRLTDSQKALIKTDGSVNVFAFHVHQNWGGRYADGGLYTAGAMVDAFNNDVKTLDATIAIAEKEGIDADIIEFAKTKASYRGGMGTGLAQLRKARRFAADARTEDFKGTAPADGMEVYILNVGAKMFLAGGNDWGTHASLNHMGAKCVLRANSSGENRFAIKTNLPNGSRNDYDGLGHNGYVDCKYGEDFTTAQGWAWEFEALEDGTYHIINADNGKYLGMTDDDRLQVDTDKSGADNAYNKWLLVTPEEFFALADDATAENPVDLGHLIHQATFSQNDFEGDDKGPANLYEDNDEIWEKYSKWERNAGSIWNYKGNSAGGDYMFEMWNTAAKGKVYVIQEVEGLPAGKYTVSMSGYYRDGNYEDAIDGNVRQLAYLYAGSEDNCVALAGIMEGEGNVPGYGRDGRIPDGCYDAAKFFQVGTYTNTIDAVVGADGKLEIGVFRDAEDVKGGDWITTDNWRLFYKGNPVEATITDAGYATFVAPGYIDAIPEGVEAFAAQVKEGYVHLEPTTAIPSGEAVVLKGAEGSYTMYVSAREADLALVNDLKAATEEVTADGTQYILAKQDDVVGFAKATPDTKIAAGKGYLVISAAVKAFYPFGEDETGINDAPAFSGVDGAIYNLSGQRVGKLQRGINIVNGKKVLR